MWNDSGKAERGNFAIKKGEREGGAHNLDQKACAHILWGANKPAVWWR